MKKTVALFVLFLVATVAFAEEAQQKVVAVASNQVCMVNDRSMAMDQIPVEVDGKTYYGCCNMCKKTLAEKPETRVAVDPVTGKQVDKATAVIGAQEDGRVFYFENEQSLAKHNAKFEKK